MVQNDDLRRILKEQLQQIYKEKYIKTEIQSIMQYPLREHLYIVVYNLEIHGSPPIRRAKIVIDIKKEELKKYDPGLL